MIVALIGLMISVIAVPLAFLKPRWVFYLFLFSCVFSSVFYGYIAQHGNLGIPRAWTPADILAVLTFVAAWRLPADPTYTPNPLKKCFNILIALSVLSIILGLFLFPHMTLTYTRALHFIPAMVFASKGLVEAEEIKKFFKFLGWLGIITLFFHILLRTGKWIPPIAEGLETGQMSGERGIRTLGLIIYPVLASVALSRLASHQPSIFTSMVNLFTAMGGIMLSETRGLFVQVAFMAMLSMMFFPGRVRTFFIYGTVIVLGFLAATLLGFDPTARYLKQVGDVKANVSLKSHIEGEIHSWRGYEYGVIFDVYRKEPYFLMTGRGLGAMHYIPFAQRSNTSKFSEVRGDWVGYYHSELMGWLDRYGVIGFITFIAMMFMSIKQSYMLAKTHLDPLQYFGIAIFLLMCSVVIGAVLGPQFMDMRGAPFLISFAVIASNWQSIYYKLCGYEGGYDPAYLSDPNYQVAYTG